MGHPVVGAFVLTLLAGLATGVGSFIAFFAKRSRTGFLSLGLGFSAGVMIYISFVEILKQSSELTILAVGSKMGSWISMGSFFAGILAAALIDKLVPGYENPHEIRSGDDLARLRKNVTADSSQSSPRLMRTGVIMSIAIAVHNFPEGLITFFGALANPFLGISLAVAIAIHNIPEGISVSVPIFYATGSKRKAFIYSFLSGLAEPIGALIGYFILRAFLNDLVIGVLFAVVAGIMVFVSFDVLLPAAREYGKAHTSIMGLIFGMGLMAVSLLLFL